MTVTIYIKEGEKIIDWSKLSKEEQKEYGRRLNEQALTALGYVPVEKSKN